MYTEPARAESLLLQALEINPTLTQARSALVAIYMGNEMVSKSKALHQLHETIRVAPNHVYSHYQLGKIAFDDGDFDLALREFEITHRLLKRPFGQEPDKWYDSLLYEAFLLLERGDVSQAEAIIKRTRSIKPADFYSRLADLYLKQRKYVQAEPLLKRALAIDEKTLGPDHPDVAKTLNNLAVLYLKQRNYAQAEAIYKRALAIDEKTLGPNHPNVAKSLSGLALVYNAQGRHDEAKELLARAKRIRTKQ